MKGMKGGVTMAWFPMFFMAIAFVFLTGQNCQAGDGDKVAALKKIEGGWTAENRNQNRGIDKRRLNFEISPSSIVVTDYPDGLPPVRTEIPLEDVKEKDGSFEFYCPFKGIIKSATIKVTPDGKLTGEIELGRRAQGLFEITFRR
jgi:hypothetical protein